MPLSNYATVLVFCFAEGVFACGLCSGYRGSHSLPVKEPGVREVTVSDGVFVTLFSHSAHIRTLTDISRFYPNQVAAT